MTIRTSTKTVTFRRPFWLKGVDRLLPPADYRVMTDEELIEGLSFSAYHRVSTAIFVPAPSGSAIEEGLRSLSQSDRVRCPAMLTTPGNASMIRAESSLPQKRLGELGRAQGEAPRAANCANNSLSHALTTRG
jgi:hypothetical protein